MHTHDEARCATSAKKIGEVTAVVSGTETLHGISEGQEGSSHVTSAAAPCAPRSKLVLGSVLDRSRGEALWLPSKLLPEVQKQNKKDCIDQTSKQGDRDRPAFQKLSMSLSLLRPQRLSTLSCLPRGRKEV